MCRSESYGDWALLMVPSSELWSVQSVVVNSRIARHAERHPGRMDKPEHLRNAERPTWEQNYAPIGKDAVYNVGIRTN
jgi:hypothetical protein